MSPCTPNDNTLNPPSLSGVSIPGFGFPFSPLQVPLPEWDLPTDLLEDLLDLMRKLGALFPSGLFKAQFGNYLKDALDFIASILSQIAPYLSLYNLIMAAFNLIICIIEVLCCIPDPFCIATKMQKLFAECLPPFLNILPWLALLAMILALLLLLLALIEYIILTILGILAEIVRNIILLANAATFDDAEATLAGAQKIATLLCFIENIMAIFLAIAAILAIIQALAQFAGVSICSDEDAEGCCNNENCPPFIKDNPDGITGAQGRLVYHRRVESDIATLLGVPVGAIAVPPLRIERWQFINDDPNQTYRFSHIITPVHPFTDKIYFPDIEYDENTPVKRAPYNVDLRMFVDPGLFNPADTGGARYMRVKECIVVRKPYVGEYDWQVNLQTTSTTGTLNLEGGKVYEDDGTTEYQIGGSQATLNDFIHYDDLSSTTGLPAVDDTYAISDIEFTFNINHVALIENNLITVGCMPGVSVEKAVQNAILSAEGIDAVIDKLAPVPDGELVDGGDFPNVLGAQECVLSALETFRSDVSVEGAAKFQATAETCLNDLKNQVLSMYCDGLISAVSQYKSTAEIDTDAQFTTRSIELYVVLKDPGGTVISQSIPDDCLQEVLDKLRATATFGDITDFVYDGTSMFVAYISSSKAGSGQITVSFDGKVFSTITAGTSLENTSTITEVVLPYTFIDAVAMPAERRDPTDVSESEAK
jgi:hypothetical protein